MTWFRCAGGNNSSSSNIQVDYSDWDALKHIESSSCMSISSTDDTVVSTYLGGVTIDANFVVPITDVTNINSIEGDVEITTGYDLSRFPFYVALCKNYPSGTPETPTPLLPAVVDSCNTANTTYHFSLNADLLTGGYYLVFILTGVSATIQKLTIS